MAQGYLAIIASMLIWGSVGVFSRWAGQDPLVSVTYRVLFGAMALALVEWLRRGRQPSSAPKGTAKPGWIRTALLLGSGLALATNWLFFFKAVTTTSVFNAVLSYYTAPVLVALAAPLVLRERLEGRTVVAMALAFGGAGLMLYQPGTSLSPSDLAGIGYGLTAAAFYAAVTLSVRKLADIGPTRLALIQTLTASVVLVPTVLLTPSLAGQALGMGLRPLLLLAVIGVVHTALALVLYFYGLGRVKVQHVGVLAYLDPVSAILFALLLFQEVPGLFSLIGGALVLGGSALLLLPAAPQPAADQPSATS